jgi:hypothetical protein
MSLLSSLVSDKLEQLQKNKIKRETETVRDSFVEKLAKSGANEDTLDIVSKIKAESPEKLTAAIENIQTIMSKTPTGIAENIKNEADKAAATTLATEKAKLDPSITLGKLEVGAREKDQALQYKREEAFLDIEKQLTQKGIDLDAGEKQKLVFAEQGLKTVKESQRLLNDNNFVGAVFQSAGGSIGKLSTAGNEVLRNYNTAIGASIFSFVFANSGAQVSDKERKAFENIYGLQIGDTLGNGRYKADLLGDFFQTARDIIDPNRVAGLSAVELKGKLNEIRQGINALGVGDSEDAKTVMESLTQRALGNVPTATTTAYEDKEKEKRYQEWKTKQGAK